MHPEQPPPFAFFVLDDDEWRELPTRDYLAQLRDRFQSEVEADGSILEDFQSSPSDIPAYSSYQFSYRIEREGGPPSFVYGYVGGAWVKYILAVKTSSEGEPPLFVEFAKSCKMLNRKPY